MRRYLSHLRYVFRPEDALGKSHNLLSINAFKAQGVDFEYDTSLGGYRTNITEEQLQGAPKYSGTSWDWEDRARGRQVYDYYGASWRDY